jgi:hypothetical protein
MMKRSMMFMAVLALPLWLRGPFAGSARGGPVLLVAAGGGGGAGNYGSNGGDGQSTSSGQAGYGDTFDTGGAGGHRGHSVG